MALSKKYIKLTILPLRALWKIGLCQISSLVKYRRNNFTLYVFSDWMSCYSSCHTFRRCYALYKQVVAPQLVNDRKIFSLGHHCGRIFAIKSLNIFATLKICIYSHYYKTNRRVNHVSWTIPNFNKIGFACFGES